MIFVANVLELNGGTTFLVRTCEALKARGRPCAVLVLRRGGDEKLARELARHAQVFHLDEFQRDRAFLLRRQLGALAPIAWGRMERALAPFGSTLHAMGAFGLIVAARLASRRDGWRATVGVYHQNEFVYEGHRFFSNDVLALFRRMPHQNVVFFNEVSRDNYIRFHDRPNFRSSPVLPIGIRLSEPTAATNRAPTRRIVSVGNLEEFKTYNRLVIGLLPSLRSTWPDVEYHIYGSGEKHDALLAQARELDVADRVVFHGRIAYDDLQDVWNANDVFVGSGTALIEAAVAGLPALVGVESMPTPHTYGFLSDIKGLSYNEFAPDIPLRSMEDCLRTVLDDRDTYRSVATACTAKARDFSVARTAAGMAELAEHAIPTPGLLSSAKTIRLLAGLPLLALRDQGSPSTAFARRRNQSFRG